MKFYNFLMRALPIYSGLTKLSFNPIINRLDWTGQRIATTREGVPLLVDLDDHDGRILYIFGTNDRKVSAIVNRLLGPDYVFLDIGANHATIGLSASRIAAQVHLFEPQDYLCDRVQDAIDQAGLDNVTIHRLGLFDRNTTLPLSMPVNHSGMASVEHSEEGWKTVSIELRDTATYVAPLVGDRRFGAKIDVEGAEPKVLPALMAMPNMKFAVCEAAHNTREIYETAMDHGFEAHGLCRSIFRPKTRKIDRYEDMSNYHDILFTR